MWGLLRHVLRHVEVGKVFFALLEDVHRVDNARLMEDKARSVKEKPTHGKIEDDRDVNRFAKARTGALVIKGVEEMDELVLFEFAVASSAHLDGRRRLSGGGR